MNYLHNNNQGMALVLCLLIMTVAALIGVGIATDSTIDGQITRNQRTSKKDFFIADGTNLFKVASLLEKDGPSPQNPKNPEVLEADIDDNLPGSTTTIFRSRISYLFNRSNLPGYSIEGATFKNYYYTTKTIARRNNRNRKSVKSTEKEVGPGAGATGLQ